jgi:GNAT superfamily N-acetyltransferase
MASGETWMQAGSMAGSAIAVRRMTRGDLGVGMRLKRIAGWNQTSGDWLRFFSLECRGCFVAEADGMPVATVTYCTFGAVAWISLLLVDPAYRRRGIATRLMSHVLLLLDAGGFDSVRLDATSAGAPIYEGLGFREQFCVHRMAGVPRGLSGCRQLWKPQSFRWHDWDALISLDGRTVRADRTKLLKRLVRENFPHVRVAKQGLRMLGYAIDRPGSNARQIGPLIASRADVGEGLMRDALARSCRARVFVDVPADNGPARQVAAKAGLTKAREFIRMCRGRECQEALGGLWASSGPELG